MAGEIPNLVGLRVRGQARAPLVKHVATTWYLVLFMVAVLIRNRGSIQRIVQASERRPLVNVVQPTS